MATYIMPEVWNESRVHRLRLARRWLSVALVALLPISLYLGSRATGRSDDPYAVLFIGSFVVLVSLWNPFGKRKVHERIAATVRVNSIDIDSDGIRMNLATWSKFIPKKEITQFEEPPKGRGIYVRTHNRFLWYVVPRRTDRYEEMKVELAAMGLPIVQPAAPLNWSIFWVFLFCASLLCNIMTQDRRVLVVNFAVALILGISGAILTSVWVDDRHLRRKSILGSFLPAAFSAFSLVFPFGIR